MSGRRLALGALWVALMLGLAEGGARLAIRVTRPLLEEEIRPTSDILREQSTRIRVLLTPDSTRLLVLDSTLGWRYRASHRDPTNRLNSTGVRSDHEYAPTPRRGVLRVAAFGDSFVYSNEVGNGDAWCALVEQLDPAIEVLNYGVGGYGVDQAYLRYLAEGTRLGPRVVLIGFALDDLGRLVNVYRRFRSTREIPLVKPRYLLQPDGRLELLPSPIHRPADYEPYLRDPRRVIAWGAHDQWYEPAIYEDPLYDYSAAVRLLTETWVRGRRRYVGPDRLVRGGVFNPASSAFRIQLALFRLFADSIRARGARPLIVLFPDQAAVRAGLAGRPTVLASLVAALAARGLDHIDLTDAFRAAGTGADVGRWFMPGGHYSPSGNRVVATWLIQRLGPGR